MYRNSVFAASLKLLWILRYVRLSKATFHGLIWAGASSSLSSSPLWRLLAAPGPKESDLTPASLHQSIASCASSSEVPDGASGSEIFH